MTLNFFAHGCLVPRKLPQPSPTNLWAQPSKEAVKHKEIHHKPVRQNKTFNNGRTPVCTCLHQIHYAARAARPWIGRRGVGACNGAPGHRETCSPGTHSSNQLALKIRRRDTFTLIITLLGKRMTNMSVSVSVSHCWVWSLVLLDLAPW